MKFKWFKYYISFLLWDKLRMKIYNLHVSPTLLCVLDGLNVKCIKWN